jgi:hypothetical protein
MDLRGKCRRVHCLQPVMAGLQMLPQLFGELSPAYATLLVFVSGFGEGVPCATGRCSVSRVSSLTRVTHRLRCCLCLRRCSHCACLRLGGRVLLELWDRPRPQHRDLLGAHGAVAGRAPPLLPVVPRVQDTPARAVDRGAPAEHSRPGLHEQGLALQGVAQPDTPAADGAASSRRGD